MSTPDSFDIRYSEMDDHAFLQRCFADETVCDAFPFGNSEKDDALKNWIGFSRYKASLTGVINDQPYAIGTLFLMPYKKVAHHCSFYLIVAPEHRRKGIGSSLVRNLLHLARTRFRLDSVNAEFYEPNPIQSILQRNGFEEIVRQENFAQIHGQGHARIIMEHFFHG